MKIRRKSSFHNIVVEESGGVRTLQFGSTIQSSLRVDDPDAAGLEYIEFFHLPFLQRETIESVLFIGLGAGSGPRQFLIDYSELSIDIVELDPAVIRVAEELFGFSASRRCRIHEDDGLTYLERSRRKWDLIVVDAYLTERGRLVIPSELMSAAFFQLCTRRLRPGGIVAFNCAAPADDQLTREIHEAMSGALRSMLTFELTSTDNTVLLGSMEDMETRSGRLVEIARRLLKTGRVRRQGLVRRCRQIRRDMSHRGSR